MAIFQLHYKTLNEFIIHCLCKCINLSEVKKILISCLIGFVMLQPIDAQSFHWNEVGVKLGVSMSVGTKINRLGLNLGVYYLYDPVQFNASWTGFWALNTFGPNDKKWESQFALGASGALGLAAPAYAADSTELIKYFNPLSNFSDRPYTVAYTYLWYRDNIGTSQKSGIVGIEINDFYLMMENDFLAGQGRDKFRTGGFKFGFRYENTLFAVTNILWTGDPRAKGTKRIRDDESYPSRFGYFNTEADPFSKYSHGIVALEVIQLLDYGQFVQLQLGIDGEQIRHLIQNQLIHDMPFIPKTWNSAKNPHVPMLDKNREMYLFKEDQHILPARFFANLSLNPPLFY